MKELKAAKHFIFMEFFIIDRGYMWDEILRFWRKGKGRSRSPGDV